MELNTPKVRVAPLGFEADLVEKLEKIFQRDRSEHRAYVTVYPYDREAVDILLVNYDEPTALEEKTIILRNHCPAAAVVAASQRAIVDPNITYQLHPYQVHGILLAARLLNVLDSVSNSPVSNQVKPAVVETATATRQIVKNFSALVVDDSLAIQKSLELNLRTLKDIGQIDFADSGEIALEKINTKQYDIIFLDVMMPGIDGYETCTQIRKKPTYKHTPIIMVSAKCSPLDEVKGIIAGCTTYLTKPVQDDAFQKLSHRMMEWLANKKVT